MRVYKYFFFENCLNVELMREAGQQFVGVHDFSNFCKVDVTQTTSYEKEIFEFGIELVREAPLVCARRDSRLDLLCATVCGSSFLWH